MTIRARAAIFFVGAIGLLMALAGSWIPHFWADERATLRAVGLPWGELWPFLRKRDAVHGVYDVFMHVWLALFGGSHFASRFPSAVAVALAVVAVTLIGSHLSGLRVGVIAGAVLALLPVTSHYGMETRSYALTCALVAWAGYCLLRACDPDASRRWWIGYGVLLFAASAVFMYALLIGLGHTVTLLRARRRLRIQVVILVAVAVLVSPLVLLASGQSGQVSWISRVLTGNIIAAPLAWVISVPQPHGGLSQSTSQLVRAAALLLGGCLWLLVAKAVLTLWRPQPRSHRRAEPVDPLGLALPWLLIPAGLLIAASVVKPMFVERYVFFSAPAFALLVGLGLAQLRARALTAVALVLLLLATPLWVADRQPLSKIGTSQAAKTH